MMTRQHNSKSLRVALSVLVYIGLLFGTTALWAQENIEGFVSRDSRGLTFITTYPAKSYTLKASNPTVGGQLRKLSNLDAIRGTGQIIAGQTLMLDTIDFVGLHKILGPWSSTKYLFNFKTFAEVTLLPTEPHSAFPLNTNEGEMNYTISPGEGNNWKVFFSNSNRVILASLKLNSTQQATITFFDEETGAERNSITLNKLRTKTQRP